MDRQQISIRIPCSKHTSQFIQRVSTDVSASQHLFCLEYVLQQTQEDTISSSTLKNIPEFVDMAAQFYLQHKQASTPNTSDVPDEYIGLLSKQGDIIKTLKNNIADVKKKVELGFDVLQMLTNKESKYMHNSTSSY